MWENETITTKTTDSISLLHCRQLETRAPVQRSPAGLPKLKKVLFTGNPNRKRERKKPFFLFPTPQSPPFSFIFQFPDRKKKKTHTTKIKISHATRHSRKRK
jgi:hypothetical protein